MSIRIPEVYIPLFELIEGHHEDVTLVIMTGGRYSGKSYIANIALAAAMGFNEHKILNARYTMTSAEKSIIPDFNDKLDMLGLSNFYTINKKDIASNFDDSKMWFSGMKTGSNTQDSALKSLSDISLFYVEEASEIPTFEEWEKVDLSVRADNVQAFSMLVLNPTTTQHWIYKKFFEDRDVPAGFNGIKDDVLYIHSTWKDLEENMVVKKHLPKFKADDKFYNESNITDLTGKDLRRYIRYRDVILGGWMDAIEGVIFPDWEIYTELPDEDLLTVYGLDWGFSNDPAAFVEVNIDHKHKKAYLRQHVYQTGLRNSQLAEKVLNVLGGEHEDTYIVADSSEPKSIADFREYDLAIIGAKKGAGSIKAGIKIMQDYDLFVHDDSEDIKKELRLYHQKNMTNNKGENLMHIVDKDNHALDAIRYAITTFNTER